MAKLWFKNKSYGWGWTPVTWQGWLAIVVFLVLLWINNLPLVYLDQVGPVDTQIIWPVLGGNFILALLLVLLAAATGEKPEWRWRGRPVQWRKSKTDSDR